MKITMATRNENRTPWIATHPGTILRYELEERNISQKDFAIMIGMQKSHLNEIIKGKRPMTLAVANKIEDNLGISSVSLVNMQNQYDHDIKVIEKKSIEEQEAINTLKLYDGIFDVKVLLKRLKIIASSARDKVDYLTNIVCLPQPAELQLEAKGLFKKSSKTGQDQRMLMTWKILAETISKTIHPKGIFDKNCKDLLISQLVDVLHENQCVIEKVTKILSDGGIGFCLVEKVDKASVDGYSYIENGVPYIILTKRYDRIDNFAFALMHEMGHIFLHYTDGTKERCKPSIPDYDNESQEEREANTFAANALIPNQLWKTSPEVRVNPFVIQKEYTEWAEENHLNKWIVLGRISYETGMYKFKSDEKRRVR